MSTALILLTMAMGCACFGATAAAATADAGVGELRRRGLAEAAAAPTAEAAALSTDADVIVIGGGMSGMKAAASLVSKKTGLSVMVLEGRNRVGGRWVGSWRHGVIAVVAAVSSFTHAPACPHRIWTTQMKSGGGTVNAEQGASWVHGTAPEAVCMCVCLGGGGCCSSDESAELFPSCLTPSYLPLSLKASPTTPSPRWRRSPAWLSPLKALTTPTTILYLPNHQEASDAEYKK